jgi:predicted permease
VNHLLGDVRIAFRQLRRSPGFTAVAVTVLALGIGATAAIYTVLDRVVLRPLPYDDSERLFYIDSEMPGEGSDTNWGVTEAAYFHLRDNNQAFEEVGAYGGAEAGHEFTIVGATGGSRVSAAYVSFSLLDVLGARPHLGRLISEEDDGWMRPGGPGVLAVAVLSHDYWTREFGGDTEVIGSTLQIEGSLGLEVVGVLEPGLQMPHGRADIWVPLGLHPTRTPDSYHGYRVIGRLAEGVTLEEATADLARVAAQLPSAFPGVYTPTFMRESGFGLRATPLRLRVLGGVDDVLWILFGAIGLLLLIAYSNVTNLFLVRGEAASRDRAVRQAIGLGRAGRIRQVLVETWLLCAIATLVGAWIADGSIRLFLAMSPADLPRLGDAIVGGAGAVPAGVIGAAAWVALASALLMASSSDLSALREGGPGKTVSRPRQRARGAMVVTQVALSLVLVAGAAMMLRSFERLRDVNPGFDAAGVLAVDLFPPATRQYLNEPEAQAFYREVVERVSALPGVLEASAGGVPMAAEPVCLGIHIEDRPHGPGEVAPCVNQTMVAPGYFRTMGIPLEGREVVWADPERELEPWAGGEVVVTRALAERLWPGEDAIGKGLRMRQAGEPYARVVGVTGDFYADGLDRPPAEFVFGQLWYRTNTLVVRARSGTAGSLAAEVRSAVRALDPGVAIGSVRSMEDVVATSPTVARTSLTLILLGIGALTGLLLSAVGLFGVLAFVVGRRTKEIGIRMAVGARERQVATQVVGDSLKLAGLGAALGILVAIPSTRPLRALTFEVRPGDPLALAAATVSLVLVALLAAWLPARRAARVDPMTALRTE